MQKKKFKVSLTLQIVIGLVLGIVAGLLLQKHQAIATDYIKPIGTIYLNLIKMIVVPVVLLSIIQGVVSLQDVRKVGSIGGRTIAFYLVTTALAVTIGLIFANLLSVGATKNPISTEGLEYAAKEAPPFMETIVNIFPSNFITPLANATMLQVIVIAILFGFGIILCGEKGKALSNFVDSAAEVSFKVMSMIIALSGIGVFALICPVVAQQGIDILIPLAKVILVCYVCYIIHMVVVYSASVGVFAKTSPFKFF